MYNVSFYERGIGPSLFSIIYPAQFRHNGVNHLERDIVHFLTEKFLAFQLLTNGRLGKFRFFSFDSAENTIDTCVSLNSTFESLDRSIRGIFLAEAKGGVSKRGGSDKAAVGKSLNN